MSDSHTLWIGGIDEWMTEEFLLNQFQDIERISNIKLIRDKSSKKNLGYGFVQFENNYYASIGLEKLSHKKLKPNQKKIKVNWALLGFGVKINQQIINKSLNSKETKEIQSNYHYKFDEVKKKFTGVSIDEKFHHKSSINSQISHYFVDYPVYIREIEPSISDQDLKELFLKFYPSVSSAKIINDPVSKENIGIVKFQDFNEAKKAINEMNGLKFMNKSIKLCHGDWGKFAFENSNANLSSSLSYTYNPNGGGKNSYQFPINQKKSSCLIKFHEPRIQSKNSQGKFYSNIRNT